MTWFGWIIGIDCAVSAVIFLARIDRPPKAPTPAELAIKAMFAALYAVAIFTIGTGSL